MRIPPTTAGFRRRDFLRAAAAAGVVASTSGLLAACGGLAGSQQSSGTGGTTIRIAHITPQTGPLAGFTEPDAYLLDLVRAAYAKGVQVGGTTYQLEIITKDAASDSSRVEEGAGDARQHDHVDLIRPGDTPAGANPGPD